MARLLLLLALVFIVTRLAAAADTPVPYLHPDRAKTDDGQEAAIIALAGQGSLGFVDQFDLGTSLFVQGKYPEAALAYRLAIGLAKTDPDRVASLLAASQSLALGNTAHAPGPYLLAASLANAAQRLEPMNAKIAYFRVARWNEANDQLEVQTARAMLERFALAENGKEVLEPLTTIVIVVGVAGVAAFGTYMAAEKGLITREERRVILAGILAASVIITSAAAPGSTPVILPLVRPMLLVGMP